MYILVNSDTSAVPWRASATAPWLAVVPTNGVLGPGGHTNLMLSVTPTANSLPVGVHVAQLLASNVTSGVVQRRVANLTVRGEIRFSAIAYATHEYLNQVLVTVLRGGDTNRALSIDLATADGTALAGQDYVATNATLTFAAGITELSLPIHIINDARIEGNEHLDITLSNPGGGGTLGDPATTRLTIEDDEGTRVPLPHYLYDGDGYLWDVWGDGQILFGTSDAYDGGLILATFPESDEGLLASRELRIGPSSMGDIEITRRIYVPTNAAYARFMEVVRNGGPTPVTHTLQLDSNLGSDGGTVLVGTSNGDASFDTNDNWLVTDDASDGGGDPSMLHVVANDHGTHRPTLALTTGDDIAVEYEFEIAPGETRIVLHVAAQNDDRASALQKGADIENLVLDVLADIEPDDMARIVNFAYPDDLVVNPTTAFGAQGYVGGPFSPLEALYTITNAGTTSLTWHADASAPWVSLSSTGGVLTGETSTPLAVGHTLAADALDAGVHWATVTISNLNSGVSRRRSVVLTILPEIFFAPAPPSVNEDAGSASATVFRVARTDREVTVDYATSNQTALAGSDYLATNGTLTFAVGVTSQTFNVTLVNDDVRERSEALSLHLSNPTGGGALGQPARTTLQIDDDELIRVALFANAAYVDMGAAPDGEVANLSAALTAKGCLVLPFTALDAPSVDAALATADVLCVPELEIADLASTLSADARGVIAQFVLSGGGLIINGQIGDRDEDLLNAIFGYSLASMAPTNSSQLLVAATGTDFEGGPNTLPHNSGSYEWERTSLPESARRIYGDSGADFASVALLPHGAGLIVFLAYDWFDAAPLGSQDGGWDEVLRRALVATSFPPTPLPLQPASGLVAAGYEGGAFSPTSQVYQLTNSGGASLTWEANAAASWITISPTGGVLTAGTSVSLTVGIGPGADVLPAGTHVTQITVSDLTSGAVAARSASLQVNARTLQRFAWQALGPKYLVGQPIPVVLTARDQEDALLASFNGSVALRGLQNGSGTELFRDGFEDGDHDGWTEGTGASIRQVTNDTATSGTFSFALLGGNNTHYDGVSRAFPGLMPDELVVNIRSATTTNSCGYLVVGEGPEADAAIWFYMSDRGTMRLVTWPANIEHPYQANRWYKNTFRLYWAAQRLDWYVDDVVVATNVAFRGSGAAALSHLGLHNYTPGSQVWFDDITLRNGDGVQNVAIAPSNSAAFANGTWSGTVTVQEPTTGMWVRAAASGAGGISTLFDTITNAHSLTVRSDHGSPDPSPGLHAFADGAVLTCGMPDITVVAGTTQYVCNGWTGTGSVPLQGDDTNTSFVLNGDSTLTWVWQTNCWLAAGVSGAGRVDWTNGWMPLGTAVTVTASANDYYHLASWDGTTGGCVVAGSEIWIPVDAARNVTAVFGANLTPRGAPEWWLAAHGLTNGGFAVAELTDDDLDGMPAWREYHADTVPTNGDSVLRLIGLRPISGGIELRWQGGEEAEQFVERAYRTTGDDWSTVFTNGPGTAITNLWLDPLSNTQRVYRIRVRRP